MRVLVVEDNHDNFELIRFLLDRLGHTILAAHNGKQGVDVALAEKPDLILMDLSMPGVDGWTAAHLLKENEFTKPIPLVAVTAHALPGDRKRALEAGFDHYLTKPINVPLFDEVVTSFAAKAN